MTRKGVYEWYGTCLSNHYDFAYNRQCFLDTRKGLITRCKSQRLVEKNVASVLMGLTLPKRLVPRLTLPAQQTKTNIEKTNRIMKGANLCTKSYSFVVFIVFTMLGIGSVWKKIREEG
jgi:hypothetical protein